MQFPPKIESFQLAEYPRSPQFTLCEFVNATTKQTPFEIAHENPEPCVYGAPQEITTYVELLDAARSSLLTWQDTQVAALRLLLCYPIGKDPLANIREHYSKSSFRKRHDMRTAQIRQLTEWDDTFDTLVEWNSWPHLVRPPDEFPEYCGSVPQASFKEAPVPERVQEWLDSANAATCEAADIDAAKWQDGGTVTPSTVYSIEFVRELSGGTSWGNEFEPDFRSAAAIAFLVDQVADTEAILAARWWIGESPFGVSVELIREAYLAGCRRWIECVLSCNGPCESRDAFQAFVKLAQMVLKLASDVYEPEAPTTLLGYDEGDILRMTFPLLSEYPALCTVDRSEIRRRWAKEPEGWESADARIQWEAEHLWRKTQKRLTEQVCRPVETDLQIGSVCRALAQLMEREAKAFGVARSQPQGSEGRPRETLEFIRFVAQECVGRILSGVKRDESILHSSNEPHRADRLLNTQAEGNSNHSASHAKIDGTIPKAGDDSPKWYTKKVVRSAAGHRSIAGKLIPLSESAFQDFKRKNADEIHDQETRRLKLRPSFLERLYIENDTRPDQTTAR